jgi:hypothetical protein
MCKEVTITYTNVPATSIFHSNKETYKKSEPAELSEFESEYKAGLLPTASKRPVLAFRSRYGFMSYYHCEYGVTTQS